MKIMYTRLKSKKQASKLYDILIQHKMQFVNMFGVSRFNQTHYWIWHNRSVWRWCDWPSPGWQPFPQPWPVVWRCERGTWWGSPGRATAAWCSRPEAAPLERWSGMTGGLGRWICGEDQHWLLIFIKQSIVIIIQVIIQNNNKKIKCLDRC